VSCRNAHTCVRAWMRCDASETALAFKRLVQSTGFFNRRMLPSLFTSPSACTHPERLSGDTTARWLKLILPSTTGLRSPAHGPAGADVKSQMRFLEENEMKVKQVKRNNYRNAKILLFAHRACLV
jgi:hypothetical protein